MALSVNWETHVITIPKTDLTLVSGTLYDLDTDWFRRQLKAVEASIPGMTHTKTHNHNTTVTIVGVTYARTVTILAPFSIEFEDGQYSVRLQGSNNNIFDIASGILVQNQVQVIPNNSAGLVEVNTGSGITEQDKLDIADRVLDELIADHQISGSLGAEIKKKLNTGTFIGLQ